MALDKKELAKFSPQERIKKLKLMEEERKREVDEIEKLIRESMHEMRTDKIAEEIVPEHRVVDISRLFQTTGEERLERTAREESPAAFMKGSRGYQAIVQTYEAYSQLKAMGSNLTNEQIADIRDRLNTAERYMTESEKAASKLDASRAVLYKLKKETGLG